MDIGFIVHAFVMLFLVIDPVSTVPVFIGMTPGASASRRRRDARNASITVVAILLSFLLFGQAVFTAFDITITAFRIAGGIIILIIALDLLKATHTSVRMDREEQSEDYRTTDIAVAPLGIPMLGGPGAISAVMVLAAREPTSAGMLSLAIIIVIIGFLCYVILSAGTLVQRILGVTGVNVVTRLMGLILLALAVQFMMDGFQEALLPLVGESVADE